MTNESAIKELKLMLMDNSNTGAMYNALKLAIEVLSNTPNTLEALECVELNNNSTKVDNKNDDLISRQGFDKFLEDAEKEAVKNRKPELFMKVNFE